MWRANREATRIDSLLATTWWILWHFQTTSKSLTFNWRHKHVERKKAQSLIPLNRQGSVPKLFGDSIRIKTKLLFYNSFYCAFPYENIFVLRQGLNVSECKKRDSGTLTTDGLTRQTAGACCIIESHINTLAEANPGARLPQKPLEWKK